MMKNARTLCLLTLVVLVFGCKPDPADRAALLPELPANLLAVLDTATLRTRMPTATPDSVPDTMGIALAPCCAMRVERTLQVTYPYTQCLPLRDFTVADLDNLTVMERRATPEEGEAGEGSGREAQPTGGVTTYYRLPARSSEVRRSAWDQIVCMTRTGPWTAALTESRTCQNYTPRFTLIITPDTTPLTFSWSGGISDHPADIGLIDCRLVGEVRTPCNTLSTCECLSMPCPAGDPCACGIADAW